MKALKVIGKLVFEFAKVFYFCCAGIGMVFYIWAFSELLRNYRSRQVDD